MPKLIAERIDAFVTPNIFIAIKRKAPLNINSSYKTDTNVHRELSNIIVPFTCLFKTQLLSMNAVVMIWYNAEHEAAIKSPTNKLASLLPDGLNPKTERCLLQINQSKSHEIVSSIKIPTIKPRLGI